MGEDVAFTARLQHAILNQRRPHASDRPRTRGHFANHGTASGKILPTIGQNPESLAACFGRKSKNRVDQTNGILALKALGHIA